MSAPNNNEEALPSQGKRIRIRNLPPGTSRDELRELGDKYGRVVSVDIAPKPDRPIGFISFLTEDDAGFTIYRLNGYRYKNHILEVSFSTSKPQPKDKQKRAVKSEEKPKKVKKPIYSLRTLTPVNPPTPSPLQQQPKPNNDTPSFKSWQDHTPIHSPGSNGDQLDQENGYVPPSEKQGYEQTTSHQGAKSSKQHQHQQQQQQPRRNNNNNNNNRGGGRGKTNYKKIDPTQMVPPPDMEAPTTDTAPPVGESYADVHHHHEGGVHPGVVGLPVETEIQISIPATQNYWNIKVGPVDFQEFLKALGPFLQTNELH